jgi:anti-anti-sigma factor
MDMAAPSRQDGVVPDESFDAQVQEEDGRIVVTVRGELDMASEADARLALTEAERRSGGLVLIDLSAVTFIGSNGLRTLLESVESLEAQGRAAELIASRPVEQVISLAGLEHRFTFRAGPAGGPEAG